MGTDVCLTAVKNNHIQVLQRLIRKACPYNGRNLCAYTGDLHLLKWQS